MIKVKRAYDPPEPKDGMRFLVDALWPRGVKKNALELTSWLKDLAPSPMLRQWFDHDPKKWDEFVKKYHEELDGNEEMVEFFKTATKAGTVTLVYGAKDEEHNNAVALKSYLDKKLKK